MKQYLTSQIGQSAETTPIVHLDVATTSYCILKSCLSHNKFNSEQTTLIKTYRAEACYLYKSLYKIIIKILYLALVERLTVK